MKNDSKFKYSKEKLNEIRVFTFELSRTFFSRTTYFLSTSGVGIQKGDIIKTEYNGRIFGNFHESFESWNFTEEWTNYIKRIAIKWKLMSPWIRPSKGRRTAQIKKSMEEVSGRVPITLTRKPSFILSFHWVIVWFWVLFEFSRKNWEKTRQKLKIEKNWKIQGRPT